MIETIRFGCGVTPLGYAFLARTDRGICRLSLSDEDDPSPGLARLRRDFAGAEPIEDGRAVAPILDRLRAFLEEGRGCDDLALDLRGTPFQLRVWGALRAIPAGSTSSYGEVARQIGAPGAARAVGAACGANPVALLVPCHRVLGAGGTLGGYRWGVALKRELLDRERR